MKFQSELDFAKKQALLACLMMQSPPKDIKEKSPGNFVTDLDLRIEQGFALALAMQFPLDRLHGEEFGRYGSITTSRRWWLDPIDGTKSFIEGKTRHAFVAALHEHADEIPPLGEQSGQVGVIAFPSDNTLYSAIRGDGLWCNQKRVPDLPSYQGKEKQLRLGTFTRFWAERFGWSSLYDKLGEKFQLVELDNCADNLRRVIHQDLDACLEIGMPPWDACCHELFISEVSGKHAYIKWDENIVTHLHGKPGAFEAVLAEIQ